MSVCPQITEDLVGPAEGWFAVDHPAVAEDLAEKTVEAFGLRRGLGLSGELKLSRREGLFHGFDELATEDFAENCFRGEECAGEAGKPARVSRRKTTGRAG